MCEESGDGGYLGVGCASDGSFSMQYFNDQYCLQPSGNTYNNMQNLNSAMKTFKSCGSISNGGDNNDGEDGHAGNLPQTLSYISDSCSSLDSSLCTDNQHMQNRRSNTSTKRANRTSSMAGKSWVTKLKYVFGGLLLLASFVMFTGILFTNRRRRRALMQRKYRQSRIKDDRSRKSRRSKSKSRRSKSKSRKKDRDGVLT